MNLFFTTQNNNSSNNNQSHREVLIDKKGHDKQAKLLQIATISTTQSIIQERSKMGNAPPVPERPSVPEGKTRICVSGFGISHNVARAYQLATTIASTYPDKYETWFYFSSIGFRKFLEIIKNDIPDSEKTKETTTDKGTTVVDHHSAPFVWLESGVNTDGTGKTFDVKGGNDMFCSWAAKEFPNDTTIQELATTKPSLKELFFNNKDQGTWNATK